MLATGVRRIEHHSSLLAERADRLQRAMQMRPRLDMDRNEIGAGLGEILEEGIARRDHQMHVEEGLRVRPERLHHARADRDVRHEMPVHHIDMDPIRAGGDDRLDFGAERGKISRREWKAR